jgi:PIN domain nuclease of toxin-antitoxin system
MTATKLFLDSSAWIQYFIEKDSRITPIVDQVDGILQTSVLSLYEIKNRLHQLSLSTDESNKIVDFIQERSQIIFIDSKTALQAVDFHEKYKLPAIDSLIYSSARTENAELLTLDQDFTRTPNTILLAK